MLAKVKRIDIEKNKRMIAISDIHGNLQGLKELLKKVGFCPDDYLFFVGDMVEKGPRNLDTLRYIMHLEKNYKVYVVRGNCDYVACEINNENSHPELLNYMLRRKKSLLNEMCESLSININKNTDLKEVKKLLNRYFKKELDWIANLPDIIETKNFIFVHAGLTSTQLEEQIAEKVQCMDSFLKQGLYMDKYCIVGHFPVILYREFYPDCNPIVDREHKIICIDGGNVVKRNGQLNAFIIPHMDSEDFSFVTVDCLKTGIILDNKKHFKVCEKPILSWGDNDNRLSQKPSRLINWLDNKIEILERKEEFSYCQHYTTKYRMWILNKYIYREKDGYHCEDSTDYCIPVQTGDKVSIVEETGQGYLIKKNGITGWYFGELKMDQ
ncbi:MAG: Metallophosphoesterase [Lachnoclostridium sp.]